MKTLKLLSCLSLIFLLTQNAWSQLGIKAGATFANQSFVFDDEKLFEDAKLKIGPHFGLEYNIAFGEKFSFVPGIVFNNKGTKVESSTEILGNTIETTSTSNLYYTDIQLHAKYLFSLSSLDIYVQGGPVIGLGVAGKFINETDGEETDTDVNYGSDKEEDDLKLNDGAFSLGVGVLLNKKFQIGVMSNTGILNVAVDDVDGKYTVKNHFFQVGVTYFL